VFCSSVQSSVILDEQRFIFKSFHICLIALLLSRLSDCAFFKAPLSFIKRRLVSLYYDMMMVHGDDDDNSLIDKPRYLEVKWMSLLSRDAMRPMPSCGVRLSVCPSVCPSVMFVYSVETSKLILTLFSPSRIHTILVYPHQTLWRYADENPASCGKSRDFRPIYCLASITARPSHVATELN